MTSHTQRQYPYHAKMPYKFNRNFKDHAKCNQCLASIFTNSQDPSKSSHQVKDQIHLNHHITYTKALRYHEHTQMPHNPKISHLPHFVAAGVIVSLKLEYHSRQRRVNDKDRGCVANHIVQTRKIAAYTSFLLYHSSHRYWSSSRTLPPAILQLAYSQQDKQPEQTSPLPSFFYEHNPPPCQAHSKRLEHTESQ